MKIIKFIPIIGALFLIGGMLLIDKLTIIGIHTFFIGLNILLGYFTYKYAANNKKTSKGKKLEIIYGILLMGINIMLIFSYEYFLTSMIPFYIFIYFYWKLKIKHKKEQN